MTQEQIQQIIDTITQLGSSAATAGWQMALARVQAALWLSILGILLGLLLFALGVRFWRKAESYVPDKSKYTDDRGTVYGIAGAFLCVLGFVFAIANTHLLLTVAIAPEWVAIKFLLGLVRAP